jgi:hypothetical protein
MVERKSMRSAFKAISRDVGFVKLFDMAMF